MKKILTFGIMLLFIFMTVSSANEVYLEKQTNQPKSIGNTLYVGGSGPGNYTKIQDAIDDASNGDTVYVYDDSSPYYENIIVDKSINLIGEDKNTTVIDGSGKDDVVFISADEVTIAEFTLTNGEWSGIDSYSNHNNIAGNIVSSNYYGISFPGSNYNIITDNVILDNNFGMYVPSSRNIISDNYFTNNIDGIRIEGDNHNIISKNVIISNRADGIAFDDVDNSTITDNIIMNNDDGVVLSSDSDDNTIIGNTIISHSDQGIALYYSATYTVIRNNTISDNDEAVWISRTSDDNIVASNTILDNNQGIRLASNSNIISDNTISKSKYFGIEIYYPGSNNILYHNNLIMNNQNAYDEWSNTWYSDILAEGNYWDDYTGSDGNGDGIGDTPYDIPGGNNQDVHPLMDPWNDRNQLPLLPSINSSTIFGNTLYVGGSGPDNYTHIQDAIDDASDGDTVVVYSGTYQERVKVYKAISLFGENRETTFIDGGGVSDVVRVTTDGVTINGFTIQNSGDDYWDDRGIEIHSDFNCISDNILKDNQRGISLYEASHITISDNIFTDNVDLIYFDDWIYHIIITNNMLTNNHGDGVSGGGYFESHHFNISDNIIINSGGNNARGISIGGYRCIISNNIIKEYRGGVGIALGGDDGEITRNTLSYNYYGIRTGYSKNMLISGNNITKNLNGIWLRANLTNSTIKGNNILHNEADGLALFFGVDNNYIGQNNIIDNARIDNARNAYFDNCFHNVWDRNYWDRPRILPKLIFGVRDIDITDNFVIEIPWVNVDWNPASKPYDIGV